MLMYLVTKLVSAKNPRDEQVAYRQLERVGIDKRTADIMAAELRKMGECGAKEG